MKIAIIQITSVLDYKVNLEKIEGLILKAKSEQNIEHFFLPEVFYSMSNGDIPTPYLIEARNEHYKNIQNLAKSLGVYILGGSAATKENGKIYNRMYNFAPNGEELEAYDKIHLFSIKSIKNNLDEARVYSPGNKAKILKLADWNIGLSICFDLRFSPLYRYYYENKVNLLTISSAFTVPTGRAHWETLLRARAIEGQCYVVAANQVGQNNEKISTYGHSMIIDPWGRVLANAGSEEGYVWANIDLAEVTKTRSRIDMSNSWTC